MRPTTDHPIVLAGLWETWCGADGSEIDTACILTTGANQTVAPISARMPVIVAVRDFDRWLSSPDTIVDLLRPVAADFLSAVQVSPRVDAVENDGPELVAPVKG